MASYRFGKRVESLIWKNNFRFWLPLLLLIAGLVLYMQHPKDDPWWPPDSTTLLSAGLVLVILVASRFYTSSKALATFRSYVLTIENDLITREQKGLPERSIHRTEITAILKYKSGDILIKSKYPDQNIGVSRYIENAEALEKHLGEFMPVEDDVALSTAAKYRWYIMLAVLAAIACIFLSSNRWLVGAGGIALLVYFIWGVFSVVRDKSIDRTVKRKSILIAIFVLWILVIAAAKIWEFDGILQWIQPGG